MRKIYKIIAVLLLASSWSSTNAQLANCKGKFLGNIMPSSWSGDVIRDDFSSYWNQVSPENAGKWGVAEGGRDNYSWSDLDEMYNFCKQNGFPFKQHVFVWGSQQPAWIAGLSQTEQREEVEEWYAEFANRYPDTDIIDVVNESLPGHAPDVDFVDAIGGFNNGANNPYLAAHPEYGPYGTGWDYIIYAFAKARDYFPNSTLLLNDYNIINNTSAINSHLEIVNILNARGLIDGVGIQAHAFSVDNMSYSQIKNNLDLLAAPGLPIHVTELDIRGDNNNESQQRDRYETIFSAFWEHPAVAGVTLWGYIEGTTWMENTGIFNPDGSKRLAMLWLEDYMASQPNVCNNGEPVITFTSLEDNDGFETGEDIEIGVAVTDNDGSITNVAFYEGNNLIANDASAPYSVQWSSDVTGDYTIRVIATDNEGNTTEETVTITINVPQGPYGGVAHPIPGTVQAEDFDLGGNGFAYYDDSEGSETAVAYRTDDDVDLEESTDTDGGYNLGYTTAGEWLEYTVDVQKSGIYSIDLRVACDGDDRSLSLSIDDQEITNDLAMPNTAGWQEWETVTINNVTLMSGQKIVRLTIGSEDYININYIQYNLVEEFVQAPYNGTAHEIPGLIEVEEYDLGGEGLGYHEVNTNGNEGGATFRNDQVDIEDCTDAGGGYNLGYTLTDEWVAYTVNVLATSNYDLNLRLAKDGDNGVFHIEIDGQDITGTIDVPNTGGWQTWETLTINDIALTAGEHEMTIVFESDYTNINYVAFSSVITGLANTESIRHNCSPNPFTETTTIKHKGDFSFEITDAQGLEIGSGSSHGSISIGAGLPSGFYFVKITDASQQDVIKVIKN